MRALRWPLPHRGWLLLPAGAVMTLGYAPFGLWPLAMLSLAWWWHVLRHATTTRAALGTTLAWGMGFQVTALYWLPWAFYKDADGSWVAALAGGIPAVLGLALFGCVPFMLTGWAAWRAQRWRAAAGPVVLVLLWVLFEWLKTLHQMGFPWLPLGAMWATNRWLLQWASVGGVGLLSALILLLALLVASPRRWSKPTAAALLSCLLVGGAVRLAQAPAVTGAGPEVRLVQPNMQSPHKWDPEQRQVILRETMALALQPGADGRVPPTVILPETAVAFFLDEELDVRAWLTDQLRAHLPTNGALVTGTVRREPAPASWQPQYFNTIAVMVPSGAIVGAYDKQLLVPFGEYIPGRAWLERLPLPRPLRTLSQSRLDYTFGTTSPLLPTPAGTALGLVCYEGIFGPFVHAHAAGADYVLNVTNDNWFTGTIALDQHAALATLRAVETGLPLVRVANTGITQVVDGYGRVVGALPINTAALLDVRLPSRVPAW